MEIKYKKYLLTVGNLRLVVYPANSDKPDLSEVEVINYWESPGISTVEGNQIKKGLQSQTRAGKAKLFYKFTSFDKSRYKVQEIV